LRYVRLVGTLSRAHHPSPVSARDAAVQRGGDAVLQARFLGGTGPPVIRNAGEVPIQLVRTKSVGVDSSIGLRSRIAQTRILSSPSPATCLKTEILTEERNHVILNAIGDLARVSALVHLEAVRDSILIQNVVQFGGIDA